ncbi:hypothetical protein MRI28_17575 [Nocardiopsis dassonvillei]|uniref:hypothetical protein n=1 Tax=Nocardiopsis dassonvillei TaxID=2014 RepID=UPI00200D80E6|nr:hypothetical protein [Nocardiopsis dassonvillei]MCK9871426.1 hypothetical protein [Nocardiopsis dassonvillei]
MLSWGFPIKLEPHEERVNVALPPDSWSLSLFDADTASRLAGAIAAAFAETLEVVQTVHVEGLSEYEYAASGARRTNQYKRLESHILRLELPDTFVVQPRGEPYALVVVGGAILYPYCVGKKRLDRPLDKWPRKLSGVVRELFTLSRGTGWSQPTLDGIGLDDGAEVSLRPGLANLPEGTRLVLIPYTMSPTSGLLQVWWGEASLADDRGALAWSRGPEELQVTKTEGRFAARPELIADTQAATAFDSGDLPEVPLSTRPIADRNLDVPPTTEPQPTEPKSKENDED